MNEGEDDGNDGDDDVGDDDDDGFDDDDIEYFKVLLVFHTICLVYEYSNDKVQPCKVAGR